MTTFNLRNGLRLLGIGALLVGVFTAALLYYSFGTTFAERLVYVFIGVIFAAAGGLLLPSAVALWKNERAAPACAVFLFWLLAILPLGLSGHAGFFSVAQSELAAQSIPAQAERARLERIETGLTASTQYASADLAALSAASDAAKAAVDAARQTLGACPKNHITKCINPANQQLQAAEENYRAAQAELRNAKQYHGLLSERENALSALASASSGVGAATGVHPLFDLFASLFDVSPATARAIFLSWSAVALELVAAFSFIIAGSLGRSDHLAIPPAQTIPALDVGGRITGDGLAHVHAGEIVLNRAASMALDSLHPGLADKLNAQAQANDYKPMPTQANDLNKSMPNKGNGLKVISCSATAVLDTTTASERCPEPAEGILQRAARDAKFQRLWAGDTSDYDGNESSADFALCLKLAFYTAGNAALMDSLFRQSGLMRDKWDKVHVKGQTYGQATIKNALGKWDGQCWKKPERSAPKQQEQKQEQNNTGGGGGLPKNFTMTAAGLYYTPGDSGGDTKTWVSPPFTITARTRNSLTGAGWGKLIEFTDPDGKPQQWAMPMRELAGTEYLKVLYDLGLEVSTYPACRALLSRYIREYSPAETLDCVERTGWHGEVFVLPDATIGGRRVILENPLPNNPYALGGALECWQKEVAALCAGNSRLAFAVSCAFAAPLLGLVAEENGGFHFRGSSSEGKTVALRVAASVWGGTDYLQRWRSTAVGIEQTAAQFNDTLLCLDEIGQVEPHVAGEIAYMLANGQGKLRGAKSGGLRKTDKWRLLFLSTGEISLAQHMKDGNKTTKAGQEIRLADIPSNAGKGFGLFENLHGQPGGADFAQYLTARTAECHGQPGRAFIEALQKLGIERALRFLVKRRKAFEAHIPHNAQGQAVRVARRFALVAATGELATVLRVTGWKRGEATKAAKRCMEDWLEARGGAGQRETRQALEQVLAFFELHGAARFTDWDKPETIIHNRAGYRRSVNEGIEYYVFPAVFKDEICKGLDYRQVAALLVQVRWLMAGRENYRPYTNKVRLPGMGPSWVCHFNGELLMPDEKSLGTLGTWEQNAQHIDNTDKKLFPECSQSVPSPDTPPHLCSFDVVGNTSRPTGNTLGTDNTMIKEDKTNLFPCSQSSHAKNTSPGENREQDTQDLLDYLLYLDPSREGRSIELPAIAQAFAWKTGRLLAVRRALEEAGELQFSTNPRATPIKLAVKVNGSSPSEKWNC